MSDSPLQFVNKVKFFLRLYKWSSTSGFIMGLFAQHYCDIVVFHPVVNGVGGNLVAIFASRLSTALHKSSINGSWASWAPKHWYSFLHHTFFSKSSRFLSTPFIAIYSFIVYLLYHIIASWTTQIRRQKLLAYWHYWPYRAIWSSFSPSPKSSWPSRILSILAHKHWYSSFFILLFFSFR